MIRERLKSLWTWWTRPRIVSVTIQYTGDVDALVRRYDELYTRHSGTSKQKAKTKEQAMSQLQSEMRPLQRSKEEGYQQRQAETQAFQSEMHRKLTEIAQGMDEDMSQWRLKDETSPQYATEPSLKEEMLALVCQVFKIAAELHADSEKLDLPDLQANASLATWMEWQISTIRALRHQLELANREMRRLYRLMGEK